MITKHISRDPSATPQDDIWCFKMNYVCGKNHTFCRQDPICENFRLGGVNACNYKYVCPYDCKQSGRAAKITEKSRRRIDGIFRELLIPFSGRRRGLF